MPGGPGLRFAIEATFIVAVAVLTIVADFSWQAIVLTMLLAWALIALVEWAISRRRPATAGSGPEPAPQPRRLRLRRPAPQAPLEPPRAADEAQMPQHVRVLAPEALEPRLEPAPEPVAEEAARPSLVAVPTPQPPIPEPPPEPRPEPEPPGPTPPPEPAVVSLASFDTRPREWNLWELERAAHESAGEDLQRDEERNYILMYLREFASSNGVLPVDFDPLVRDSFGDILAAVQQQ